MNNKFPQLNLDKFAHNYQSFFGATCNILREAERYDVLKYVLTDDINSQYKYCDKKMYGNSAINYLNENHLSGDKEMFLSFFNAIIPNILLYFGKEEWKYDKIPNNLRPNFTTIMHKFTELILDSNNSNVFNLDFFFNYDDKNFQRKIDEVTTESINANIDHQDGDNKIRYEECVSDFLLFTKEPRNNSTLFYNESLDRLKKVVENTLQNKYKRPDDSFPKIHEKKELSRILFESSNPEFENLVDYVVKNIHHEKGGKPKNFTEKEYVYLWLELNKILYLLNRYSK